MRFILRRLGFYAIALWGAITLNFLLPRLMPGSPLDGLMSRMSPSQLAANPHMVENLRRVPERAGGAVLPGVLALPRKQVFTGNFGISTSNFPTPVSEVIARTLPVLHRARRHRLHVRVRARNGPRDGRRLAPGWLRRQPHHAGIDHTRRVSRLLHGSPRRLLPRARDGAGSRSSTPTTSDSSRA